jgi:ElaB/YqjD/DUF883 family membrane-anchored ribosome-binding protein
MINRINVVPLDPAVQAPPLPSASTTQPQVAQQLGEQRRRIVTYVQENPAVSVGTALFLGVLIGWFIKRR